MIYSAQDIQTSFLNYFKNKNHQIVPGSSVIPKEDKTLLFTNAGMNQFKDYFTGASLPPYQSAVTSQRCIRAGGKHNDLDQVGFTSRHLTNFSMLGNFSFGSYFKKEAIFFAWEYLTTVIKLDKNLLWVTIYKDDEEAFNIWKNDIQIEESKISRLGEKDNFWQMGDVGPCGPCSEIYFDKGIKTEIDKDSFPGDDKSERFMEIWNLVFMQYEKQPDGSLLALKKVGIDTGMGLERLASVVQKKDSIFQTDLFMPLINYMEQTSNTKYDTNLKPAFHVLCDHLRTVSLLIFEGVIPSNEGRGYVLRKIIRRALLFSRKISNKNNFFASLVNFFITNEQLLYNNLLNKKEIIYEVIINESIRFFDNLDLGISLFTDFVKKQSENKNFSGINAFILYDTYGFPLEITSILAQERGMTVDIEEYENEMLIQQNRSRSNQKFKIHENKITTEHETEFLGYTQFSCDSIITEIHNEGELLTHSSSEKTLVIILDKTVFYPTGGGQIHDTGDVIIDNKNIAVLNVKKYNNAIGLTINTNIKLSIGDTVSQLININKRIESQKHHSAVHLLHKFISIYFNDNSIYQNGSYVCDEYFTLDVVMKNEVTYTDKKNLEMIINSAINEGQKIIATHMTLAEAESIGAFAQFTEKYNKNNVRVITMEGLTTDLCGGCHAKNTKDLGFFILKEVISGGTGIKRFVGMVGNAAYNYIQQLEETILNIKINYSCPIEKISEELIKRNETQKLKDKESEALKIEYANCFANFIISAHKNTKSVFINLPIHLKYYERYIIDKIKYHFSICCFYTKKNENNYLFYSFISDDITQEEKSKIEYFFKTTLLFQGKEKNNIYQGIVQFKDSSIFNIIK